MVKRVNYLNKFRKNAPMVRMVHEVRKSRVKKTELNIVASFFELINQ